MNIKKSFALIASSSLVISSTISLSVKPSEAVNGNNYDYWEKPFAITRMLLIGKALRTVKLVLKILGSLTMALKPVIGTPCIMVDNMDIQTSSGHIKLMPIA